MLLARYGVDDYYEFVERYPDAVDLLAKGALAIAVVVRRRLWRNIQRSKEVLSLGDDRNSKEQCMALAKRLALKPLCCQARGIHREFIRRLPAPISLERDILAQMLVDQGSNLYVVVVLTLTSIACLERMHAISRRVLQSSRTNFTIFAGTFVICRRNESFTKAKHFTEHRDSKRHPLPVADGSFEASGSASISQPRRAAGRSQSEFEVYKNRYYIAFSGDRQIDGRILNPLHHQSLMRDAFHVATPQEKILCAKISRWSRVMASDERHLEGKKAAERVRAGTAPTLASLIPLQWKSKDEFLEPVDQAMVEYRKQCEPETAIVRGDMAWCAPPAASSIRVAQEPWHLDYFIDYNEGRGAFSGQGRNYKAQAVPTLCRLTSCVDFGSAPPFPPKSEDIECGELCSNRTHHSVLLHYRGLKNALDRIVKTVSPRNKAALISSTDCIMAITGVGRSVVFYRLADAKAMIHQIIYRERDL
jgi:hypothetical protein